MWLNMLSLESFRLTETLFANKLNSLKFYCDEVERDLNEIKISTHILLKSFGPRNDLKQLETRRGRD